MTESRSRRGAMLVVISGPSGVGKDTIIDALKRRPHAHEYHYVVTCTTRHRRPGEIDGVSYHFSTRSSSGRCATLASFLEANEVHGRGTARRAHRLHRRRWRVVGDVILKIDVQGAQVIKETVPEATHDLPRAAVARGPVPPAALRGRPSPSTSSSCGSGMRRWSLPARTTTTTSSEMRTDEVEKTAQRTTRSSREAPATPRARCPSVAARTVNPSSSPSRLRAVTGPRVEVAVDAVGGAGGRTWTYAVPERLSDLAAGEAVLVDSDGVRPWAVVLASRGRRHGSRPEAISDGSARTAILPTLRSRSPDGSPGTTSRPSASCPSDAPAGMLERLELVAERRLTRPRTTLGAVDRDSARPARRPDPQRAGARRTGGRAGPRPQAARPEAGGRVALDETLVRGRRWTAVRALGGRDDGRPPDRGRAGCG